MRPAPRDGARRTLASEHDGAARITPGTDRPAVVITGLLLQFLVLLINAVLSVLPAIPVPSWLTGSNSAFGTVFTDAASMSVWFPTTLALTVLAAYLAIKLSAFSIKVARIVASFLTGGGGSAA